jgi:hypothetical protein
MYDTPRGADKVNGNENLERMEGGDAVFPAPLNRLPSSLLQGAAQHVERCL